MMKTIHKYIFLLGLCIGLGSCEDDFIDLEPNGQFTDAVYFEDPGDFDAFALGLYNILPGWDFNTMDNNTDLSANNKGNNADLGQGTIATNSTSWSYNGIRRCNILLQKASSYDNPDEINQYTGEAYFLRAFSYFNLLKTYGGVPIITTVLDVDSPELYAPRNSRYEVIDLILSDLDEAIDKLPLEQNIAANYKGRVSKFAAKAFKAQVLLYEATWEKYVGRGPDGDGVSVGAGTAGYNASDVTDYFQEAITLSKDVMDNGGYEIWNKNDDAGMDNLSSWYLFNLEDAGSNPGGYDKSTNKEFILYTVYDFTNKQSKKNISWTSWQLYPSRKYVDMAVCTDGLPIDKSPLFQGYHETEDEFENRDMRLLSYLYASPTAPSTLTLDYGSNGFSGYENSKFAVYGYGDRRIDGTESANWPILRLAEVYLTYAEALVELNGTITDDQLNESINILRDRGKVAPLTNALATQNNLNMLEEIRRERAVELYREGKRFDDLKRWGILEESLNPSRLGKIVGSASYQTDFKDASGTPTSLYHANTYVFGEQEANTPEGMLNAVVIESSVNHSVQPKHYLYPIPFEQRQLNNALLQNPGY